jgi:hypothetical protein
MPETRLEISEVYVVNGKIAYKISGDERVREVRCDAHNGLSSGIWNSIFSVVRSHTVFLCLNLTNE